MAQQETDSMSSSLRHPIIAISRTTLVEPHQKLNGNDIDLKGYEKERNLRTLPDAVDEVIAFDWVYGLNDSYGTYRSKLNPNFPRKYRSSFIIAC